MKTQLRDKHSLKYMKYIVIIALLFFGTANGQPLIYPWLQERLPDTSVVQDIEVPQGFIRVDVDSGSFANWLRHLPLKSGDNRVRLYDGRLKKNQKAQFRIIDIDIGNRDLQHCADAVIRLQAEYLYSIHQYKQIAFDFTSGDRAEFWKWAQGYRPIVKGNDVTWKKETNAEFDTSYNNFRAYLDEVFMYAGTYSLAKEMEPIADLDSIRIGDVFIKGGFPGHVVIVIDLAIDKKTNKKAVLLAQSYMPAQEIHIIKNPTNKTINPWYLVGEGDLLVTPEYTFSWGTLKRFKQGQQQ